MGKLTGWRNPSQECHALLLIQSSEQVTDCCAFIIFQYRTHLQIMHQSFVTPPTPPPKKTHWMSRAGERRGDAPGCSLRRPHIFCVPKKQGLEHSGIKYSNAGSNSRGFAYCFPRSPCCYKYWCFTALQHLSGHFRHGQLSYPHCSWASLLRSLPALSAHSFASNWQLPFSCWISEITPK